MTDKITPGATRISPNKTRQTGTRMMISRTRILLFAFPLLLGWYVIIQRRTSIQPLPSQYAICSNPKSGPSIFTVDSNNSILDCLVISKGSIVDRGSIEDVKRDWGDVEKRGSEHLGLKSGKEVKEGIKIIRIRKGQTVLPGLIDSHAHLLQNGELAASVSLVGSTSISDCIERIALFISSNPKLLADRTALILGGGWDQTKFTDGPKEGGFPTASDLEKDERLTGRPIVLKRVDVHALWVSNSIIKRLGELPETVEGGLIVRSENGEPTGIFVDNAMVLVTNVLPTWSDLNRLTYLKTTARKMLTHGLTGAHDAMLSVEDISFLTRLDKEGKLPIRIYGMVSCVPINTFCDVERYDGNWFQLRAVKIFSDGALGSHGAAMLEPYTDNPTERGILISDEATFLPLFKQWIEKGFQVNSHAIGDRANSIMLNAYEQSLPSNVDPLTLDLRSRIEHAQIITIDDIVRMGKLGVIASVQPTHATSDMGYAEARIGQERIKGAYAWKSLIENGTRIALGSDFPVEEVNPFLGMHSAIFRTDLEGNSPHGRGGWYVNEALTFEQTLRGFTIDGAFASFQENRIGSLEIGKEADFILIDRDFRKEDDIKGIAKTKVLATVVSGRVMYGKIV